MASTMDFATHIVLLRLYASLGGQWVGLFTVIAELEHTKRSMH